MEFYFDDDQRALQGAVREVLQAEAAPERVRATVDGTGFDAALWRHLAEVGALGLTVPQARGGFELDEISTILVLEEAGRFAVGEPLIETIAIGAPALAQAPGDGTGEWLARIAAGEAVVTAVCGEPGLAAAVDVADLVVLPAGPDLAIRPAEAVTATPQPGIDGGRRLSSVAATSDLDAGWRADAQVWDLAWDRGALGAAAQLLGVGARAVELATEHARTRQQFGQPIGTFQAVKHLLADALVALEFARPAVYRAAWSVARNVPDRSRDVSIAKVYAAAAATTACRTSLQVHGAIGYTWEHDLQLWLKRALSLSSAWGTSRWHRGRVADAVMGRPSP